MSGSTSDFHALHVPGRPLLLPNGWDYASIAVLAGAGFAAVGTTSLGVAAAAGKPDGTGATLSETVSLARRASGLCLLSVDLEGGFSEDPEDVARVAASLADAGVVGVNVEDGRSDGTLTAVESHAAVVAAIKRHAPELFVNARTDTYWLGAAGASVDETERRLRAYADAGADGVFVPGVSDRATIARLVGAVSAPLNVLYTPDAPPVASLAELGVARVSLGSLLFRASLGTIAAIAESVRRGEALEAAGWPGYAAVQELIGGMMPRPRPDRTPPVGRTEDPG